METTAISTEKARSRTHERAFHSTAREDWRGSSWGPRGVNRTSRADARLMTPEGVIAGQKARPHVKAAAACGNPLEQRRNRATVILCPAGQPNACRRGSAAADRSSLARDAPGIASRAW